MSKRVEELMDRADDLLFIKHRWVDVSYSILPNPRHFCMKMDYGDSEVEPDGRGTRTGDMDSVTKDNR